MNEFIVKKMRTLEKAMKKAEGRKIRPDQAEEIVGLPMDQLLDFYEELLKMKETTEYAIYCKLRMEKEEK